MKIVKTALRFLAFLVVLMLAIYAIPGQIFGVNNAENYMRTKGYYKERKGALDAVFIGASNVHRFYLPATGWQGHGIAVYNFSFNSLPIMSFPYLIKEARKTQPDALYIINLNTFKLKRSVDTVEKYHVLLDYMPLSMEKISFIHSVSKASGFSLAQQLELLFPFIRYHSLWSKIQSWSYGTRKQKYKNSAVSKAFIHNVVDYSDRYEIYDTREEPHEDVVRVLTELLDFLDREHVNALFVKVPQAIDEKHQGYMNVLEDLLESRGYPCLDLMKQSEAYGLNPQRDFNDSNHTNIRGAYKMTEYMAEYLVEHYHFTDKRGQADYADWDKAGRDYDKLIDSWILPFEREKNLWQDLPAPKIKGAKAKRSGIQLTWSASKGADGYVIYRKTGKENDGKWRLLATVSAETLSYADEALDPSTRYTYCVAPFCDIDGQRAYGNYKIKGVSCMSPKKLQQNGEQDKSGGDGN